MPTACGAHVKAPCSPAVYSNRVQPALKQVYTLYSRESRKGVRVLFHGNWIPESIRGDRESFAEWLLKAPADAMLSVTEVRVDEPEPARIHSSVPCALCGERVMETRLQRIDGKLFCIPCAERMNVL